MKPRARLQVGKNGFVNWVLGFFVTKGLWLKDVISFSWLSSSVSFLKAFRHSLTLRVQSCFGVPFILAPVLKLAEIELDEVDQSYSTC